MAISLEDFVRESNAIEGIMRDPTMNETVGTQLFLSLDSLSIALLGNVQAIYTPDKPLRRERGMDVQVGRYIAPRGGWAIMAQLERLLDEINGNAIVPQAAHVRFEMLHPYMDGNGRTGRVLWAWHMHRDGQDPFVRPFLQSFYYQTLERGE